MSQTTVDAVADPHNSAARERPPTGSTGPWAWARANLFGILVVHRDHAGCWATSSCASPWASSPGRCSTRSGPCRITPQGVANTAVCQNAKGIGACWAVIADKYRLILFGRYPYDQQWRPAICVAAVHCALRRLGHAPVLAQGAGVDLDRHAGGRRRADVGRRAGPAAGDRGPMGRPADHADPGDASAWPAHFRWRSWWRSAAAPPTCRRSRCCACVYVELIRGVPLIAVLFMASVMFPLFMPNGRQHRQAAARAGRHHPVRRRLSRRGGARRAAGAAEGPGRGGRRAGPELLEEDRASSSCRRRCAW